MAAEPCGPVLDAGLDFRQPLPSRCGDRIDRHGLRVDLRRLARRYSEGQGVEMQRLIDIAAGESIAEADRGRIGMQELY